MHIRELECLLWVSIANKHRFFTSSVYQEFGRPDQDRGGDAVGSSEIPLRDQEFLGFGRVLSEIYLGFRQDCGTPHSYKEEGSGFSMGA